MRFGFLMPTWQNFLCIWCCSKCDDSSIWKKDLCSAAHVLTWSVVAHVGIDRFLSGMPFPNASPKGFVSPPRIELANLNLLVKCVSHFGVNTNIICPVYKLIYEVCLWHTKCVFSWTVCVCVCVFNNISFPLLSRQVKKSHTESHVPDPSDVRYAHVSVCIMWDTECAFSELCVCVCVSVLVH